MNPLSFSSHVGDKGAGQETGPFVLPQRGSASRLGHRVLSLHPSSNGRVAQGGEGVVT